MQKCYKIMKISSLEVWEFQKGLILWNSSFQWNISYWLAVAIFTQILYLISEF